jgi:hypothetical protein
MWVLFWDNSSSSIYLWPICRCLGRSSCLMLKQTAQIYTASSRATGQIESCKLKTSGKAIFFCDVCHSYQKCVFIIDFLVLIYAFAIEIIDVLYIYIYITAIWLTPGDSSTAHICTQIIHRLQRTEHT